MRNENKEVVQFPDRERAVATEMDLENNFALCKECIIACFEANLTSGDFTKEIPVLADFEAGYPCQTQFKQINVLNLCCWLTIDQYFKNDISSSFSALWAGGNVVALSTL